MALSCATMPGQSGPGSNSNEGVLHISQSSSITGASSSDCLVSYSGHSLWGGSCSFCRGAVGVFYNPSQLDKINLHYTCYLKSWEWNHLCDFHCLKWNKTIRSTFAISSFRYHFLMKRDASFLSWWTVHLKKAVEYTGWNLTKKNSTLYKKYLW